MSFTSALSLDTDAPDHGQTSKSSTPKLKICLPPKVQIKRKIRKYFCLMKIQRYICFVPIIIVLYYLIAFRKSEAELPDYTAGAKYIESQFEASVMLDKGTGCEMPETDPFAPDIMQYEKDLPKIGCRGKDWVKCYLSECKVVENILASMNTVSCTYYDIIYENDFNYHFSAGTKVLGKDVYKLTNSDHVKIRCTGYRINSFLRSRWNGHGIGFRTQVERIPSPPGREDNINVLMFGYDSASRNGFIRRMPRSYDFLMKELDGTLFTGYNILGYATEDAMFPILTGHSRLELPSVRKSVNNHVTMDNLPFIFKTLKADGFRTLYFEDGPWCGTFQCRYNGFLRQPSDHYIRPLLSDTLKEQSCFCMGATTAHEMMMNSTDQFFKLDGKKFAFTFISYVSHDYFQLISTADDATYKFLRSFKNEGYLENTLLVVLGDHGPRYSEARNTIPGKLEVLQPLLYIRLPEKLRRERASALRALKGNARTLTTAHDLHATLLDALGMRHHRNMYKVPGAHLPRGMSLLEPIPRNRSCSEAGISSHYCICLNWRNVSHTHKFYEKTAHVLVDHINALIQPKRDLCLPRYLISIKWLLELKTSGNQLSFIWQAENDSFVKNFAEENELKKHTYQVKVVVGPGNGMYEATMVYIVDDDRFVIETSDISRVSAYGKEPYCISATDPHLNPFCYCKNHEPDISQTYPV